MGPTRVELRAALCSLFTPPPPQNERRVSRASAPRHGPWSRSGRQHAYWVTVFVTEDKVVTVEAGGDESFFDSRGKAIGSAIASVEAG